MVVRLRRVWRGDSITGWGYWVALCAAENPAEPRDVYIDDDQDHALRIKYIEDYKSEGLIKED